MYNTFMSGWHDITSRKLNILHLATCDQRHNDEFIVKTLNNLFKGLMQMLTTPFQLIIQLQLLFLFNGCLIGF